VKPALDESTQDKLKRIREEILKAKKALEDAAKEDQ
jgi:hypothetical protein